MIKTILFLSFTLFLRLSLFAQEYEHLQPFTDYGNCGHGLKTPSGKIILEPFYDRIDFFHQREDRKSGYWIVTQSEKVGIINEKGQWLFPLEYDRISMTYDRRNFICTKDSTTNFYDKDFQLVFTGEGISRMDEFEEGYIVVKENRYGIMNLQFEWVIPCQYNYVYPVHLPYFVDCAIAKNKYMNEAVGLCSDNVFQHYFHVINEQGRGIVNEKNEVIIPICHTAVEIVSSSHYFQNSPRFFYVFDRNANQWGGTSSAYTFEGKPINPNKQDTLLRYCLATDSSQTNYHCFALYKSRIGKKDQYKIVNTLTLEQSAYYDDISVFYDRILVRKGTLWSVLTDQLDIAWSGKLLFANWQRINLEDYTVLSEQRDGTYYSYFDNPSGLDHRSPHFWIFDNTEQLAEKDILGIQDYEQNVSIPLLYEKIFHYELNGESYFWAYGLAVLPAEGKLSKQVKAKLGKIDVYNNRFELLNTIEQRDFMYPPLKPTYNTDANQALFFVDNQEQRKKIYDLNGKSLFQDDFLEAIFQWNTNYFTLQDHSGFWGMYDFDGKQLLPHNYDQISCSKFYTIATRYDVTTVFDSLLNVVADSMKFWPTEHKSTSIFHFTLSPNNSLAYLEKNNQVYLLNDYKLVPINDQNVNMMGNYLVLSKELIVDRNGQRIAITDDMHLYNSKTYPYCLEYIPVKSTATYHVPSSTFTGWKSQSLGNYRSVFFYYRDGKKVSETGFDKSFNIQKGINVASVNNKYCFVDENLNQIGSDYYKFINPFNNGWLTSSHQGLRWHDKQLNTSTDYFTKACSTNPPGRMIVFKENYIGILNDSMQFVFPLKSAAFLHKNDDLTDALGINAKNNEKFTAYYNLIHHPDSQLTRLINNMQIIWHAQEYALTPNDAAEWYFLKKKRSVRFVNSHYVSFAQSTNNPNETSVRYTAKDLDNYAIKNYIISELFLTELVPKENWEQLDALLLVEINKGQYFGQNCVNVQQRLDWMKQHFLLTETGISFHYLVDDSDDGYFSVELPYTRLKDLLVPDAYTNLSQKGN